MNVYGTRGRIDVEIPFNSPSDRPARVLLDDGSAFAGESAVATEFPAVDQYTLQADRFADAVRGASTLPIALDDAVANMAVIDALFRSAETSRWESPADF
jgi:predicted dehydrogenase